MPTGRGESGQPRRQGECRQGCVDEYCLSPKTEWEERNMNSADHSKPGSLRVRTNCEHRAKGWRVEPAVAGAASDSVAGRIRLGSAVVDLLWTGV